ncbi:MAG: arginine repressor [Candidatus Nanopelagicales bacterium]|jgi:transcriptional regulator of arginine metabolism|nr:arginine repressor [Candidatus Nanopelagicales bacterium]
MTLPTTRAARHRRIVELLDRTEVASQAVLAELLAADGFAVTQATLSRDLDELGAVKVPTAGGELVYAVPAEGGDSRPLAPEVDGAARLGKVAQDVLVSVEHSANIVVLRTPPGGAQYLASAIDRSAWPEVIGTVAGDDTVLLVTRAPDGAAEVAAAILSLVGPRR